MRGVYPERAPIVKQRNSRAAAAWKVMQFLVSFRVTHCMAAGRYNASRCTSNFIWQLQPVFRLQPEFGKIESVRWLLAVSR